MPYQVGKTWYDDTVPRDIAEAFEKKRATGTTGLPPANALDDLAGGDIRGPGAFRTRKPTQGSMANAARVVVPTVAGMGAGALTGGNPWAATAAAAGTQAALEYALEGDAERAANVGVISGGAGMIEEGLQQQLIRRAPQAALRLLQQRLGIPDGVLQTMAPAAISALTNVATTMFVKGGAPTANEAIEGTFFGLPGMLRSTRLPTPVRMPDPVDPRQPNPAFMVKEGTPQYQRLMSLSRDDFASEIMREAALAEQAKQRGRAPEYLGTTDPSSPEVAADLAAIRGGAQARVDFETDRNLKLNQQIGDMTEGARRTVGESEELRVQRALAERDAEKQQLQSSIDFENEQAARQYEADIIRQRQEREAQIQQNEAQYRAEQEQFSAEKTSWDAQQAALQQAQRSARMGSQVGAVQSLPGEPINPADAIAGAAAQINEPPRIPKDGLMPKLQGIEADPFVTGMEADQAFRGSVSQAREIAENNYYKPALNGILAAEDRLPTKTLFTAQDQRAWVNELNFLRDQFRTILSSNQGQMGPAYSKLGQLVDLLDRGAEQGGIVNAHGLLKLHREINKAIRWDGGDIDLPGQAKEVAARLRGTMFDMLDRAQKNAPEPVKFLVDNAMTRWNTAREIHRAAYGVEGSLERIPASKQERVGLPGEKVPEVKWAERFGKAITDPAGDFARRRVDLDGQIANMFEKAKMPASEAPSAIRMAADFERRRVQQELSNIINEAGAEITPKTLQRIEELRRSVPPESLQDLDIAYKSVESSLSRQKVDTNAAMDGLFGATSSQSGKASNNFIQHSLPALQKMSLKEQQGVWRAVIQDRMEKAGVTKKITAPEDIQRILADPVVSSAPPEFQEALRSLASGELSDIIMGKVAKFPKEAPQQPPRVPGVVPGPRPEKIQMDEAALASPKPYPADVLPDLRTPKVPLKIGETILHLKDLAKIDDLSPLWMKIAITGHEQYGPRFVKNLKSFVGEDGWKRIQESWKAIHGRDAQGEFDPARLRAAIIDQRLPQTIKDNVLFNSHEDFVLTEKLLGNMEIPIQRSTERVVNMPEQTGSVVARRFGALVQFLRANAATILSATGAGGITGGGPGALAAAGASTAAAATMFVLKPRSAAREMLGDPTRMQRYLNILQKLNKATGGISPRYPGLYSATTLPVEEPTGDTRRER